MLRLLPPLTMLFMAILLAGAPSFALGSSSHPFILQWGQSGLTEPGNFASPQNIAIDSQGNVYVTDLGNMWVQKFDNNGVFLKKWGGQGSDNGQFESPIGITIGENSTVYVVDSQLSRVQAFDSDGNYIFHWGVRGDGSGQFALPNGITTDKDDNIYVVDTGNHRIQKFTSVGQYQSEFGQSGINNDEFISPMGITINTDGNIFVSDSGDNSIKKFDSNGVFLDIFDSSIGGQPLRAQGLQSDPQGNIYVADSTNDRILRLDSQGTSLSVWGSSGIQSGQFKMPKDVALDNAGHLFVVDSNGHRIQKFATPLEYTVVPPEPISPPSEAAPVETPTRYALPPVNPVEGDLTKPTISPPNDLVIEATGTLTPVNVGQALVSDESGIQSLTNNAPDKFTLGINTVIWTAIDGAGNMAIATQSVTVADTVPPTISNIAGITVEASNPSQNQVELTAPIATDAVGVISIENDAPEFFPIGQTTVTWTASDILGNTASTLQVVNVIDTTIPEIYAPADIILEATSLNENEIFLGEASVIDNGEIISITNDAPPYFILGNSTVTWLASDASGNRATAEQLISLIDTTIPEITSPEDIIFEATSVDSNIVELILPDVNDIQDVTISNDAPAVFALGDTTITWTATDASGNNASSTQNISVIDTISPILTVPADITIEATGLAGNIANIGEAAAEDVTGVASINNNSPESFLFGNTTVTWVAEDNYGNSASATQIVSVIDTVAPSISAPSDIMIEATSADENSADLGDPTAGDLVEVRSISNDAPNYYPIGMTTITWNATDSSGNTASDTQIISIVDTTIPEITSPEDIVAEATGPEGEQISLGEAVASDLIGIESITNDAPDVFPIGETIITWTATDLYGNTAQSSQNITILDTISPILTAPEDITVQAQDPSSNTVDIGSAQAEDAVGVVSITNNSPESYPVGETEITWTATDAAGNTATATQTITVTDDVAPIITAPEDIIIEATSAEQNTVSLIGAAATDAVGVVSISNDAPDNFLVGETIVTWTASDAAGNHATDTQLVTITDTTPPVLNAPSSITVEASNELSNAIDYGTATATDQVGIDSIHNDAPDVFPLGLTSITWTASDAAGNEDSAIQQVIVSDTIAPQITSPPDIVLEASSDANSVDLGNAQASDAVVLDSVYNDAPDAFPLGDTLVTWTAQDSSGNSANATQTVSIIDTTPPSITASDDIVMEATSHDNNIISLVEPDVDDSVSSVQISNDAPSVFSLGETIITWSATDETANTSTDTQTVSIIDTTSPIISIPDDIVIEATSMSENDVDIGNAQATDLVEVASITNDAPSVFPYGETTVTWTATDSSGNTDSDTQSIMIIDTTAPTITAPSDVIVEATGSIDNIVQIGTATADDIIEISSLSNDAPELFLIGETTVTWTAIDQDGNSASATQLVSLIDTTPPELIIPPDVVIDAVSMNTLVDVGIATSTDLIDPDPQITHDSPEVFPLGQSIVTWSTTDMFGNTISATQIVDVQACGKPIDYYNVMTGGDEDDIITGTVRPDLIFALGGDDIISADKGNDCIFGGEGDDIIFGQEGNDTITGNQGNDIIKGNSGIDVLSGESGIDVIDGGDDIDSCNVSEQSDGDLIIKCEN